MVPPISHYRELPPPAALAPFITCLWTRRTDGGDHLVVPDGSADVMWVWDGREPLLTVAGPDTAPRAAPLPTGSQVVGVRFRPGAAGAAGLPMAALRDAQAPVEEAWGPLGGGLAEAMLTAARPELALAGAVAARLPGTGPGLGPDLAAALLAGRGPGSVRRVADDLGLTERSLHRRSVDAFGYGPKTAQRVLRFQDALARARRGDDLARVAAEAGYADQPHLSRDVKALAGMALTDLLAR